MSGVLTDSDIRGCRGFPPLSTWHGLYPCSVWVRYFLCVACYALAWKHQNTEVVAAFKSYLAAILNALPTGSELVLYALTVRIQEGATLEHADVSAILFATELDDAWVEAGFPDFDKDPPKEMVKFADFAEESRPPS